MTRQLAKRHEVSTKHSSKVAATFFRHPESEPSEISECSWKRRSNLCIVFKYVGKGEWLCQICKTDAMTTKKAKAHEIRCQGVGAAENEEAEAGSMHESLDRASRSEGNNSTTSTHQRYDDDDNEDEEEEEDDDGDDDDDEDDEEDGGDGGDDYDYSDAAFVENFFRNQDVDASHKRRMQSFYEVCCAYTFAVSNR
jgi:hypothetical protein